MVNLHDFKAKVSLNQLIHDPGTEMRISDPVLKRVCKNMIEIILYCLPQTIRGTVCKVGPTPPINR